MEQVLEAMVVTVVLVTALEHIQVQTEDLAELVAAEQVVMEPLEMEVLVAAMQRQVMEFFQVAEVVEGAGAAGKVLAADKNGIVVACGQEALRILELQREGGKRLTAEQFLVGQRDVANVTLDPI